MPWYIKIIAKLLLARLPISHDVWQRLRLFRAGSMDDPGYALAVFRSHFQGKVERPGFTLVEIGPGDSLLTALIARAHGAERTILVDVVPLAQRDLAAFRATASLLAAEGLPVPDLGGCHDIETALKKLNAEYRTGGLADLRQLPDGCADLVFSHAVLEHVPPHEFLPLLIELRRITRKGGVNSHQVDLRDHLAGGLNNLRFADELWERPWFAAKSGFYTNRLRHNEIMAAVKSAGFTVGETTLECWDRLPIERAHLAPRFRHLPDEELLINSFRLVLE